MKFLLVVFMLILCMLVLYNILPLALTVNPGEVEFDPVADDAEALRRGFHLAARGGRGSAERTQFTMFNAFRASFASDAESAKPASKNAANTVLVFFFNLITSPIS